MDVRARYAFRFVALLLFAGAFFAAPVRAESPPAADDEVTVESIVNDAIVGHAEDGNYLDFKPMGTLELPRIFVARTAEGGLTLDVYGSTKSALKSGTYGLVPHHGEEDASAEGDHAEDFITAADKAELQDAFANKAHLHAGLQRASGSVVVDLSITRHFVFGLLAMAIVLGIFLQLARRYKRGAGRTEAPQGVLQNMMEVMVVFIRDEVAKPNIGPKYQKFLPYLLTAFFFILTANILGLVPYAGAATSNIAVTLVLAVTTFGIGLIYGTADHYKHLLLGPPDAPVLIRIILVPVEILGLITRHAALAIRLFANMIGGSLIIFSLIGLVFIMNTLFGGLAAYGAGIISTGFTVFVLLLKLVVAFIQAYVFTILSALFIGMSVEEHGHEEDEHEHERRDESAVTPVLEGDGMLEEDGSPVDPSEADVGEPVAAR
jgi:F-type H+-transporting ATPase subunit a